MTQSQEIQKAFDAVATDITNIQNSLTGQTSTTSSATPEAYQYPINPVELLPPDPAQPLPESMQSTQPANTLKSSTPVDIQLACHNLNNFDLALTNQLDLHTDNNLNTAIIISLFTDRYDQETQQGGYWGDQSTQNQTLMGSRLWKLQNAKVTTDVLRTAEDYASESLQWLLDDQLATAINIEASWLYQNNKNLLQLQISVTPTPDGPFGNKHYKQSYIVASQ